jgi:O-antigen ligase
MAHHHFLFGYGYGAFWRGIGGPSAWVWAAVGSTPPHSHNGFLDAWLDLGLVGVILVVTALIAALASAWKVMRIPGPIVRSWPFVFVLFLLLSNLTESSLVARNSLSWTLFVAVTAATQLELARNRREAVVPAGRPHGIPRVAGVGA